MAKQTGGEQKYEVEVTDEGWKAINPQRDGSYDCPTGTLEHNTKRALMTTEADILIANPSKKRQHRDSLTDVQETQLRDIRRASSSNEAPPIIHHQGSSHHQTTSPQRVGIPAKSTYKPPLTPHEIAQVEDHYTGKEVIVWGTQFHGKKGTIAQWVSSRGLWQIELPLEGTNMTRACLLRADQIIAATSLNIEGEGQTTVTDLNTTQKVYGVN